MCADNVLMPEATNLFDAKIIGPRRFLNSRRDQELSPVHQLHATSTNKLPTMPPRLHRPSRAALTSLLRTSNTTATTTLLPRQYATATITANTSSHPSLPPLKSRLPTTQPISLKPAQFRKTQLLRQYASLLRSTPLLILFQHNNLNTAEWTSLRRELAAALAKMDAGLALAGEPAPSGSAVKLQIVQTGIFAAALRVVDKAAHEAVVGKRTSHGFAPLLAGPVAVLSFPTVSPAHLKAALTVLAPLAPEYPAPTRRAHPGWHDNAVQTGLQKLQLLGARVEGKVFDMEGARWVGMIPGGLDGLRAQVVHLLQSAGAGVTNALESAGKNLFFTVEGRRMMLEEEAKGPEGKEEAKAE
ncbi:hypothetical protein VE04_06364 [Pseudogymnoascus sp. 24MN13]|nr:hypothetical protein VE04_06364 [Pseudogymnoascus sp. 24MN13]